MAEFNPRDKSRTSAGKTRSSVRKHTSPPKSSSKGADGSQRWQWFTIELMESPAFTSLSANAKSAFFRVVIEHTSHGGLGHIPIK